MVVIIATECVISVKLKTNHTPFVVPGAIWMRGNHLTSTYAKYVEVR